MDFSTVSGRRAGENVEQKHYICALNDVLTSLTWRQLLWQSCHDVKQEDKKKQSGEKRKLSFSGFQGKFRFVI